MYFLYILKLRDGTYYTGQTKHLVHRLTLHRSGKGSKYVRSRLPFTLVYTEVYSSRSEAMRRELEIKQYTKAQKIELVSQR